MCCGLQRLPAALLHVAIQVGQILAYILTSATAMADLNTIDTVAPEFAKFYYTTFDTNRAGLQTLYVRHPLLTDSDQPRSQLLTVLCTAREFNAQLRGRQALRKR